MRPLDRTGTHRPAYTALITACLLVAGLFMHVPTATAQANFGVSRIVSSQAAEQRGPAAGLCADVPHGSKTPGTEVNLFRCHDDGDNQYFRLKDYALVSRISVYWGAEERCLAYREKDGWTRVVIDRCEGAPKWEVSADTITRADDRFACLTAHPLHAFLIVERCMPSDAVRFGHQWGMPISLTKIGPAGPILSAAYGRQCLDVEGGSRSPGASMIHHGCNNQPWQSFQLYRWHDEASLVMIGVYQGFQLMCLSDVPPGVNDAIEAVPCNPSDPRQVFKTDGLAKRGMTTRLRNLLTGRCMDAYKRGPVGAWACHGGSNQLWHL